MPGPPHSETRIEDVVLASATVGTYDAGRFQGLPPLPEPPPIELPIAEALPLSELQSLRRQRDELLDHVAQLVQQRDAYRARVRKLERSFRLAEQQLRCLRGDACPADELRRPTERQLHSPHISTRQQSERPAGTYCLQGPDVPVDESVCLRVHSRVI